MPIPTRRLACALLLIAPLAHAASDPAFKVPDGFEITQYAGDNLAHDIFSMTIDAKGRVVVAGKDYVRTLHDTDGDGVADKATIYSTFPKSGAHGMYFDGDDLIATGDMALLRLRDADGDGAADGPPEVLRDGMKHTEHGVNGVVKGPDGWYYVICGNDARINETHAANPGSPVKKPEQGALVRFAPDFKTSDILAHGFRNPYDLDFSATGQVFTVDSDGERDHHLPWYAGNRLFDIAIGGHHGWMLNGWQRSWNRPAWFFDNTERLVEIGRGSPTGVVTYRHRQFPERYRDGVFSVCWTFGTVYFFPLTPRGATFDGKLERFMQTTGSIGFAPVDIAVGPEGDMFVAIGGRGTQGGVYRIRYTGGAKPAAITGEPVDRVLRADQPLASWSRAQWLPLAKSAGVATFEAAAADEKRPALERVRAIEVLVECFDGVSAELAARLSKSDEPLVAARTAWALSRRPAGRDAQQVLAGLTYHKSPVVQRAAWEAINALPELMATLERQPNWKAMSHGERRVRSAAIHAARTSARGGFMALEDPRLIDGDVRMDLANLWFEGTDHNNPEWMSMYFEVCVRGYNAARDPATRLEAVRLMQIGLGDIRTSGGQESDTGYSGTALDKIEPRLVTGLAGIVAPAFPSGNRELDMELARLLGMLRADRPHLLENIAARWTNDSPPNDDVHYLLVAAQLPGRRASDVTRATAHAFATLHGKMEARQWFPSRFWPARIAEAFTKIAAHDPHLPQALVDDPAFGRVDHALFAAAMEPGPVRQAAARRLMQVAAKSASPDAWSAELVEVIASSLPAEEALPALRPKLTDARLRDPVALALASFAQPADRAALVQSLDSSNGGVVEKVAKALVTMDSGSPAEMAVAIKALGRHEISRPAALGLDALLARWSGQKVAITDNKKSVTAFKPWLAWFTAAHPKEAAGLAGFGGVNAAEWQKRLAGVDWPKGDAKRGSVIYQQRVCAACHDGARKLGPDLKGIASRFSREDLFANIVDPNQAISPTYRALQITMKDGSVHIGVPVYESPDSTILETMPGVTVRLTGDQVASSEPARRSPMPEGLLLGLSDGELADFYAYLQTLK